MSEVAVIIYVNKLSIGILFAEDPNLFNQIGYQNSLSSSRYTINPKTAMFSDEPVCPFRRPQDPIARSRFVMLLCPMMKRRRIGMLKPLIAFSALAF